MILLLKKRNITESQRTREGENFFKLADLNDLMTKRLNRGRTGLMVRASDSGSGDPGSILGRVGVLFP